MAIISFGYIDKQFLIYASLYITVTIVLNIISIIITNIDDNIKNILKNIPQMLIIIHGSLILAIIFECYLRKRISNEKIEILKKKEEEHKNNMIMKYIYNEPKKINIKKNLVILILIIFFDYIYDFGLMFYEKNFKDSELVFGEVFKFLDVFFLLGIFRLFHKIFFYRHQYISLFIILFMGLGKFFITIFYDEEFNKSMTKNFNYFSIIAIIIFPLLDSINIYFVQKLMVNNYFTSYYICFLIGIIYLIISTPIIISFSIVDCGDSDICQFFSNKNMEFPDGGQIILLVFYSIFYSSQHFIKLLVLNKFSVFHFILCATFGELINSFFQIFPNFRAFDLIINIIVYFFEIFGVIIFMETIELNFCGLSRNTKKNIMFRAGFEQTLLEESYNLATSEEDALDDYESSVY